MNVDKIANLLGATVTVALVTTIVMRPNSANVIRAFGEFWSETLKAATGR